MKKVALLLALSLASVSYAALSTSSFSLAAGETKNLVECVQWPADYASAQFNPPAKVNGELTCKINFCVSSKVIVEGPTTVTLEFGTPEPTGK